MTGNWGFLVNDRAGEVSLAPVFDCGSCLLPQADENVMRRVLEDERELSARIYTFPGSMLKVDGRKINYAEYLAAPADAGLSAALAAMRPRIAALDIAKTVGNVSCPTDLQRQFYVTYLSARRDRLFGVHVG